MWSIYSIWEYKYIEVLDVPIVLSLCFDYFLFQATFILEHCVKSPTDGLN